MKETIDERGFLRLTAETAMESYALGAWSREYFKNDDASTSTLVVENVQMAAEPMPDPGPRLANCTQKLKAAGKAYPRTCAECGLGPCRA